MIERTYSEFEFSDSNVFSNKQFEKLIKSKFNILNFGKTYENTLNECKLLEKSIEGIKLRKTEPKSFIFDHVTKLKNQVDLRRAELKKNIDKLSDATIRKLESFEKECYENLEKNKLDKKNEDLIKEAKYNLDEWNCSTKLSISTYEQRNEI